MNKLGLTFIVVMLAATASMAQLKTVTDYYLAMPGDLYSTDINGDKVTAKAALTKHRRSLIKIEDIKNGYLRLEGPWEGWADIALFKRTNGSYIVGQAETGCGPACTGSIKFWSVANGKWSDFTKSVFAELKDAEAAKLFNTIRSADDETATTDNFSFYYLLPREGTTIKAACNECTDEGADDFVFAEWSWNGTKFTRK
ncbi:MAG TPA: hypothetical protein PKA82_04780 [Pyrinomonadaceae bacterium]|nr:hypothetical protein [Pyrinomonadaceae bacterium]